MKKVWGKAEQGLWDCFVVSLRGLYYADWITVKEYDKLVDVLQSIINKKDGR